MEQSPNTMGRRFLILWRVTHEIAEGDLHHTGHTTRSKDIRDHLIDLGLQVPSIREGSRQSAVAGQPSQGGRVPRETAFIIFN